MPALADRTVKAGDTGSISFEAFDKWTLTVKVAAWRTFSATQGDAGAQTVGYTVTNAAAQFDLAEAATVTLTVGTEPFDFKFTREAPVRELKIYDTNDRELQAVVLNAAYGEAYHADIVVKANFDWDLEMSTDWPSWLLKPERPCPEAEEESGLYVQALTLEINPAWLNTQGTESTLVFKDPDKISATFSVPVRYFGADTDYFTIVGGMDQITVDRQSMVCDADGNPTDKNYVDFMTLGPFIAENLQFYPLNVGYTDEAGEDISGTKVWITCQESYTRNTFPDCYYRITFDAVPDPYGNPANPNVINKAYVCLLPPDIVHFLGSDQMS